MEANSRGVQLKVRGGNTCDRGRGGAKILGQELHIIWGIFNREAANHFVIGLAHGGRKQQVTEGEGVHFKYFFAGMELCFKLYHILHTVHTCPVHA